MQRQSAGDELGYVAEGVEDLGRDDNPRRHQTFLKDEQRWSGLSELDRQCATERYRTNQVRAPEDIGKLQERRNLEQPL